jgi:hypothetical protein
MANIRIDSRFGLNPRTGLVERTASQTPSSQEMLQRVKRVYATLIHRGLITEEQVNQMITKVQSGTRNIHYLDATTPQAREVAHFILREMVR